jgi:hypothetical protein
MQGDRGGNEATTQRERWSSQTHRNIRIGEMPVHKMKFVVVNNMAPRNPSVCAECSRPLERGYLHDLSTSKRYCLRSAIPAAKQEPPAADLELIFLRFMWGVSQGVHL